MNRFLHWLPALLWALTIFVLSSMSKPPEVPQPKIPGFDKAEHFAAYAILGALVFLALQRAHKLCIRRALLLAVLITSAYGATDEFHQRYVPNRACDVWDWTADTLGGVFAALACVYESHRSQQTNR
jgi:VanZ family protein